jgi:carbon-monoxide dehydrogenase medium subunit
VNPFTYLEPASVDETLALLAQHGDEAKLIAGGTALVTMMNLQLLQPTILIGLRALPLTGVVAENGGLRIGALTTLQSLATSGTVRSAATLLSDTCRHVATVRVRSMATLGGALSHADPQLDTPPAVIALDGRIVVRSGQGQREVPADQFFTGYFETVLKPDELVTDIVLPAQPARSGTAFLKFLPTSHDDYALVSVAARLTLDKSGTIADARIALGSIGQTPVRATAVEDAVRGQAPSEAIFRDAAPLVRDVIEPLASARGSVEYRSSMAVVHVRRALSQAAAQAAAR